MNKLENLRFQHEKITFQSFTHSISNSKLNIEFKYLLSPDLSFSHKLSINFVDLKFKEPSPKLIFLLGVMELVSYWKLACPSVIEIKCGVLNNYEKKWFKDLYRSGLGEFFYVNELDPKLDFDFVIDPEAPELDFGFNPSLEDKALVMVGGGKDSLVSLRSFSEMGREFRGFVVSPIPQALDSIKLFSTNPPISVERKLSPKLLKLPKRDYFNGHIPFSAVLAFIGLVTADSCGYGNVVTSNESTANEGNVIYERVEINHQYSKTFDFETRFRDLVSSLGGGVNYYSFLRPLSELQITGLLSTHEPSLSTFLSCNRAQTMAAKKKGEHGWCGICPKCVFTFLSLVPFLTIKDLFKIWTFPPVKFINFFDVVRELCGFAEHKPFECVGSYQESRTGFSYLVKQMSSDAYFNPLMETANKVLSAFENDFVESSLDYWDSENNLSSQEEEFLREQLKNIRFKDR